MKHLKKFNRFALAVLFCAGLAVAGFAASAAEAGKTEAPAKAKTAAVPKEAWDVRCSDKKPEEGAKKQETIKQCEMYQRLSVSKTGQRVAEFAIGFPEKGKNEARGVIILPLGVLLTEDMQMQIDDGQKFKFKVRYCTEGGCLAYLNMNKTILEALRKGSMVSISGKVYTGRDLLIKMSLNGYGKALKQVS